MNLDNEELEATKNRNRASKEDLEKARQDLKDYIETDEIYQDYKRDSNLIKSDFDWFCVRHCEAINLVLQELDKYEKQIDLEYVENNYVERKYVERDYISKEKIREKIEKLKEKLSQTEGLIAGMLIMKQILILQELLKEGENDENDQV